MHAALPGNTVDRLQRDGIGILRNEPRDLSIARTEPIELVVDGLGKRLIAMGFTPAHIGPVFASQMPEGASPRQKRGGPTGPASMIGQNSDPGWYQPPMQESTLSGVHTSRPV